MSNSGSKTAGASEKVPSEKRRAPRALITLGNAATFCNVRSDPISALPQVQQHQLDVVVEEELAVAGGVPLTAHVLEPLQQRQQAVEIPEPLNLRVLQRRLHAARFCLGRSKSAIRKLLGLVCLPANGVPNGIPEMSRLFGPCHLINNIIDIKTSSLSHRESCIECHNRFPTPVPVRHFAVKWPWILCLETMSRCRLSKGHSKRVIQY
ncbi:MAG TPA: hypothetical protein VGI81_17100 [Tepidisphaeraceae bacterium]